MEDYMESEKVFTGTARKRFAGLGFKAVFAAVFVFTLVFAGGCGSDLIKEFLGGKETQAEDDGGGNGGVPDEDDGGVTKPSVIDGAANVPSIKAKFGIGSTGTAAVTATFSALHNYIQTGGLDDGVIKLGDWIDLEGGITVEAYGEGEFSLSYNVSAPDKLRLIVVGINSFHSGRGSKSDNGPTYNGESDGLYNIADNDNTPHVVFQFKGSPVKCRINSEKNNAGGYPASEMRKYLTTVGEDTASGKFLAGLTAAGVPDSVLWGPKRRVTDGSKGSWTGTDITDKLWLPTEREVRDAYISPDVETAANQARLEYYTDDNSRKKSSDGWRLASSHASGDSSFCSVGSVGGAASSLANNVGGCAPAFCVR